MATAVSTDVVTEDGEVLTIEYETGEDGCVIAKVKEYPAVTAQGRDEEEARAEVIAALAVAKVIVKGILGKDTNLRWVPRTLEDVNRLMEYASRLESECVAIEHRKKMVLENLEAQENEIRRKIRSLFWLFGQNIRRIAEKALEGKTKRSIQLDYGLLQLRNVPGRREPVLPPDELVQWAEKEMPDIVRVRKYVNASDLPDDMVKVKGAGDAFYVRTGKGNEPIYKEEPR